MKTTEIIILPKAKVEKTEREMIEEFIKSNPDKYHVYDTVPYSHDSITKPTPRRRNNKPK